MAWTAPMTWTANSTLTAAQLNQQLRDNLLETCAATATTAGDIVYADAANSMGNRVAIGAANSYMTSDGTDLAWRLAGTDASTQTSITDTSTTYVDLSTWGFTGNVETSVTVGDAALVMWKGQLANNTAGSSVFMSYSISGASTSSANDSRSIMYESSNANDAAGFAGIDYRTGLNAGSTTFTLEARASGNTGSISRPEIFVMPF